VHILTQAEAIARYRQVLLDGGLVTNHQIDHALNAADKTGAYFGEVLIGLGLMSPQQVAEATSKTYGIPAIDLNAEPLDELLIKAGSGQHYLSEMWMPVRILDSGKVLVATIFNPEPVMKTRIEGYLKAEIEFAMSTSWDIRRQLLRIFSAEIAHDASLALYNEKPEKSAKVVLDLKQKVVLWSLLGAITTSFILWPLQSVSVFLAILSVSFFASILYKYYICLIGARLDNTEVITKEELAALDNETLPVYTVLVPVYKEENIVGQLVKNLGGLDYPENKLEVLILTEEDDQLTRDAIAAANPPKNFHVIIVPDGVPRTKPRACNVGLYLATGEFIVIYDAEDTPEPQQLKKAVLAFRKGEASLVCVQAALNYFNDNENFLTRMFTLEYSYWFDYMLTGLEATKMPIPLGGTSNHFKTDLLTVLGGWDPWNVTEDADLGIRASALGYTVGTINSTTMEEANTSIPNFVRQRSRWIKGYMQTTLVHLREPIKLVKAAGLKQAIGFLFLIGGTPATFLSVIPLYILSLVVLLLDQNLLNSFIPQWVLVLCLANLFIGNALMIHVSMMGPFKRNRFRLVLWAFLNPVYWLLHSVASYKALWQLIVNPHYWEKTNHGLTKMEN
jgi:glycosyltransferase XagB